MVYEDSKRERLLRWFGAGLVLLGVALLALSEDSADRKEAERLERGETDESTSESTTKEISAPSTSSGRIRSAIFPLISGRVVAGVGAAVAFVLLLNIPAPLVSLAVSSGYLPGAQFSPAVESGIVLGTLISLGNSALSTLSDRMSRALMGICRNSLSLEFPSETIVGTITADRAVAFYRIVLTASLGFLFVAAWAFVISEAYTPIQFLVSPKVVENPFNFSQWRPRRETVASILSSAAAAVLSLLFVQIVPPIYRFIRDCIDERTGQ